MESREQARAQRLASHAGDHAFAGRAAWDKGRTRELFERYKNKGDASARDQLIMNHLNLVRFLASKFKNRGEPVEDLVQVGTIGLIKAIDRFDPERGLEFTTYATPTIMGEIKRHFRDKGWSVRVPRRLQELSSKVNQATDELTNQLQHTPSVEEIAEHLGTSVEEVLEAMESSSAYSSVPLEGGGSSDDEEAPWPSPTSPRASRRSSACASWTASRRWRSLSASASRRCRSRGCCVVRCAASRTRSIPRGS